MALPQLPEMDDFEIKSKVSGKTKPQSRSETQKPKVSLPKTPLNQHSPKEQEDIMKRPKIPKTQYDSDGKPVLMIPDLDDIGLNAEIDRFFGN